MLQCASREKLFLQSQLDQSLKTISYQTREAKSHPPRPANCTRFCLEGLFLFRSLSTDPRALLCERRIEDFDRAQIVKFVSFTVRAPLNM